MKNLCMVLFTCLLLAAAPIGAQEYICGDIDNDGDGPDIDDLVWLVDWMVSGGPPPDTMNAANFGGCAGVDVNDLAELLHYLWSEGFPECDDTAECDVSIGGAITLDTITGTWLYPGAFMSGQDATINLRVANNLPRNVATIANGFQVYSPTGIEWLSTSAGTTDDSWFSQQFDIVWATNHFSCDGVGADTVGFFGARITGTGIPSGYNQVAFTIELQSVGLWSQSGQICIDTC